MRGTFFLYDDKLYYKTRGCYKYISYNSQTDAFTCTVVTPYVPVILINTNPSTCAGDVYQPENRLSVRKTIWYNAQQYVREYYLPVQAQVLVSVTVDGVETHDYIYEPYYRRITFNTAPPVTNPPTNNTVRITYEYPNPAVNATLANCRYAAVCGGQGELCVVMAGDDTQPNAYYWSGNSNIKMDAAYFPIQQYQLAASTDERITGFGKQQNDLIVFKEHSVGKTEISTQEVDGRIFIDMPYKSINTGIGCDLPWSIQLIENNLCFANKQLGVFMITDTSSANENNIVGISRKVNGNSERPGLLSDLTAAAEDETVSCDDGSNYYLTANGHTWVWNYEISNYLDPSWFYFTNTPDVAVVCDHGEIKMFDSSGRLVELQDSYNDHGSAIERVYRFPTCNFGGYDRRKNINSVLVTLGALKPQNTTLTYQSDYETRADLTNLQVQNAPPYPPGVLPVSPFAPAAFRRRPMCRRVLHFTMTLSNSNLNEDLELISAQILYVLEGRLR